jgi:predicted helicase
MFVMYSRGVATSRDVWAYNFSEKKLADNMNGMISFYNEQAKAFQKASAKGVQVKDFIDYDPKKINWSRGLIADVEKNNAAEFKKANIRPAFYRPFTKEHIYFHRQFNDMIYRMPVFYPKPDSENLVICLTGVGNRIGFSVLISNLLPDLHMADSNGASQNFPLYVYQSAEPKPVELSLGDAEKDGRRLNVSDFALKEYRTAYKDAKISKEDIFYYVYGILHSLEYRTRFAADLTKMLPRIPMAEDFRAFNQAGRKLAEIHLNYEAAKPYPVKEQRDELVLDAKKLYIVEKMRFGKTGKETDKTKIQYNSHITLTGIPLAAYDYIVNGKPAIEWIMERYQFSKDKDSQIINDPNDWAREHDDPKYILNLLKNIITVSIETMKIVNALPPLNEKEKAK